MADLGGFQSVASEMAENGMATKVPMASSMSQAITIPNDAMPVKPPPITSDPISSMPLFQDQNFTNPQLIVTPTTPLSGLSPIFEFFTTSNQVLSLDQAYLAVRGVMTTGVAGVAATTQDINIEGATGDQFIWDEGGIWSLIQNLTVQINGTPLPNFQSGNVIAQLYTHPVIVPQTYSGDVAYAYNTQLLTRQGCIGTDQFFNRKKQGQVKPFSDFTGFTETNISPTVGQQVYFRIPLKNLWTFYQQPGRLFTNDAKLRFNFVLSSLTLRGTNVMSLPLGVAGGSFPLDGATFAAGYGIQASMQTASQPVSLAMTDMYFVLPMYNCTEQLNHQTTAIVAERPLSFLMNNVEVYADTFYQNIDLSNPANWGKGPNRLLLKGSGYLPKHIVAVPTATVTWGSTSFTGSAGPVVCWPFGIVNLVWTRTCIMPGWLYYRRVLLGGQPYYDDQLLSMWGINSVLQGPGGWIPAVEERTRLMQQQGNYLDAPDQMWLNGYQNVSQLAQAFGLTFDTFLAYGGADATWTIPRFMLAQKIAMWMMGCGLNGIPLSQDPALDTLAESRQQSLEVETYSMPFWGEAFSLTTPGTVLMPFAAVDSVWYKAPVNPAGASFANRPIRAIPTGATMSVQHCLPYPMLVDYGRGRSTQYAFVQPAMESTTNVPM